MAVVTTPIMTDATGQAIATALQGMTAMVGPGVPSGGTTDQFLKKDSNTDYDTSWGTITIPSASSSTPAALGTAAAGSSSDFARADHVHAKPSVSDIGAAPAVTEITNTSSGDVTLALDAGKIYHFTGAVTSLTLTLTAAGSGIVPQYHFDFDSGSTAATISITGVTWPGGSFTPGASKHYEVDILNGYAVVMEW